MADDKQVVGYRYYERDDTPILMEQYAGGTSGFFVIGDGGNRIPFTNFVSLQNEGSVLTKDEFDELVKERQGRYGRWAWAASKPSE